MGVLRDELETGPFPLDVHHSLPCLPDQNRLRSFSVFKDNLIGIITLINQESSN